jgi:hypothetical protein
MARHGHLGGHRCLKVPHHGSSEAEHPRLMTSEPGRPWLITPYNRGAGLPSVERADGLPMLIDRNREVLLTAIPASLEQQPVWQAPGVVRLADLADRARGRQAHRFADPGVVLGPTEPLEPLDPVWCAAFDDQGRLRGRWRGSRALSVVA